MNTVYSTIQVTFKIIFFCWGKCCNQTKLAKFRCWNAWKPFVSKQSLFVSCTFCHSWFSTVWVFLMEEANKNALLQFATHSPLLQHVQWLNLSVSLATRRQPPDVTLTHISTHVLTLLLFFNITFLTKGIVFIFMTTASQCVTHYMSMFISLLYMALTTKL